MDKLTNFHVDVLEALARFEYLATHQMMRLGLSKNLRFIQNELLNLTLVNTPFIEAQKYGANVDYGKLPYIYYLTKEGVEVLNEIQSTVKPIKYPASPRMIGKDYHHRMHTIDCMISAYLWARKKGGDMLHAHAYYGRKLLPNGKRSSPTTVSWLHHHTKQTITPDAVIH